MELLSALNDIINTYGNNLSAEEFDSLTSISINVEESYWVVESRIESWRSTYQSPQEFAENWLTSKVWLLPSVLDRRDVVIVW